MMKQEGMLRAELERWEMRNEEMETRLYNSESKLHEMKQIYLTAEKMIKALMTQKKDEKSINIKLVNELKAAVDFLLLENDNTTRDITHFFIP
jgi:hypothetical protein